MTNQTVINWDLTLTENIQKTSNGIAFERRHTLEYRPVTALHLHEKPSSYRVAKMVELMRSGAPIPVPQIAPNGFMMDGHCRTAAAKRIQGKNAIIPLEVREDVDIVPPDQTRSPKEMGL
jgi:hypothetical protein